ncbi:MAG: SLBB domain-containing protein [Victivallales bacterium]|nr:SLBB domain-containing protein [Victivallales bacterium]
MNKLKYLIVFLAVALIAAEVEYEDDDWNPSALRPGDVLSVNVFRVPDFSKTVRIEEDGTFIFPFCGAVPAVGKTPREIARELEKLLVKNQMVTDPMVDVIVSNWSPRTVYIIGEVKSSSSLELPTFGRMTALQAISAAGGFTESADLNNVAVLRRRAANENEMKNGKKTVLERIRIDVSAMTSTSVGGDDFRLRPEDTLVIPKAPPVFLSGEVGSPGLYYVDTQKLPLCSELLVRGGGMKGGADASNIRIIRVDAAGNRIIKQASLRFLSPGIYENDMRIEPGDYVMVCHADQIYVLGSVGKPGPLTLGPYRDVTASQAIALCGGFSAVAKQSDVSLIRGREIISVNLKKLYDNVANMDKDVKLQYGDILFVHESIW